MSNYDTRVNPDLYSIAPPTSFLSLAPTTSASYSQNKSRATSTASSQAAPASPTIKKAESVSSESAVVDDVSTENAATLIEGMKRDRRTSSMASNGSTGRRYLKLGPIHGDEDHSAVWSEVVE